MNDEELDLLSALVDDRVVEPRALAALLERPEARAALVDMVALRAELREDDALPGEGLSAGVTRRLRARSWRRLAAAAAALLLAVLAGWTLRGPLGGLVAAGRLEEPPKASEVVRFERGVDWHGSLGARS